MTAGPEAEPYVGLRPYDVDDVDRFFGRSAESYQLISFVLSSRLVVVYGPSGVGKTSLIQAGVLSGLAPDMAELLPVARLPRASTLPSASMARYNPLIVELLRSWDPDKTSEQLQELTISQFLVSFPVVESRFGGTLPLIAVIDQFEEVFSKDFEGSHRDELLDQLARAMADVEHLHLVLSMRQDALAELLPDEPRLSDGNRRRFKVRPLDPDAALDAVAGPLRRTSRSFAPGAAATLVDRLRTTTFVNELGEPTTVVAPTVEPINLQVVCSALWRGLPDEVTTITTDHLHDFGNVGDALMNYCVTAVREVATDEGKGIGEQRVWAWLEERFITDLGTRSFVYEGVADTGGMPHAVARAFERRWILRSEERSGSTWFELLHDGFIDPIRRGRRLSAGLAPDSGPDTYLRKAERALYAGMLPLAEEYAKGAVRASEQDLKALAEANSLLGKLAVGLGRAETGVRADELFETAEDRFRRAAELFETEQNSWAVGRVLASLGRLYMERGRSADAVAELRSALERLPGEVGIRLDFARALSSYGQTGAAFGEYTRVLRHAPAEAREERVEALVGRGSISAELEDPTSALHDLDDAIRLRPDLAERPDVVAARNRAHARMEHRP